MTRWLRAARSHFDTIVLVVGVIVVIYAAVTAHQAQTTATREARRAVVEARRTHIAICEFRQDLVRRVQSTEDFLETHPDGFAGISRATIEVNLDNQRRTIRVLKVAACQ